MDVRLSAEQRALRDSAAQVVDRLGPRTVRGLDDDERRAKLDAAVGAAGWRELRAADEGSAPLASGVEVSIVAEELGRGLADAPFLGPTLAAELRRLAGAPPATVAETVLFTSDLGAMASVVDVVVPAGALAVDAAGSEAVLVLVGGPDGASLGTIPHVPGGGQVDLTRSVASVSSVDSSAEVVPVGGSLSNDDLDRLQALGLALVCADLVGAMQGAVDLSVAYAAERRQYGAAIGSFQAVQHLLADAHVATEGSRSLARHAAWAVDALPVADALAAAAGAKAYASRAARSVCETAIQVHGGIGNTWECLAHVYLRRALLSIDVFGGVGPNLDRVLVHAGIGR
jgi:alkylation response protein AidB-like acyl-CoA dehydrogenase